jgi:hypothetical protein
MIRGIIFALLRTIVYALAFYFVYRLVAGFFRGLTGKGPGQNKQTEGHAEQQRQKTVQSYEDVTEAKFKDIPPERQKEEEGSKK